MAEALADTCPPHDVTRANTISPATDAAAAASSADPLSRTGSASTGASHTASADETTCAGASPEDVCVSDSPAAAAVAALPAAVYLHMRALPVPHPKPPTDRSSHEPPTPCCTRL